MRDAPQPRNSILFAFTDGEEAGLLGAEAFFSQHAWANDVDRRDQRGRVRDRKVPRCCCAAVLAAVRCSMHFVPQPAIRLRSRSPKSCSSTLPNDTDLSVSNHAGKPGVDFAFVGERNHYHTRARLDREPQPRNAAASRRKRAAAGSCTRRCRSDAAPNRTTSIRRSRIPSWLAYRPQTGLAISICIVALLGLATWRRWQGPGHFFAALGIVGSTLVTIVVLELATLALADLLAGTRVAWPANPWPWRLIIYSIPIVAFALQRPLVRRVGLLELVARGVVVLDAADARAIHLSCRWRRI